MKILFIGLGSIGQRHLMNSKKIFDKANFYALRKKKHKNIIKETKLIKKASLKKYYGFEELKDYKSALKLKPDLTFICNQSSKHLIDAYNFAKNKSNLFIEKPLGNSEYLYKKLYKEIKKNKLITMMGYQTRFHPVIIFTKNILKKNIYGKICSATFKNLSYLPKFHLYENYKDSYAAKKKLGGGALSTLIHEVDLIASFFGMPSRVFNIKNNNDLINIDAEEEFMALMKFKNRTSRFNLFLHLSLSSFLEERNFTIIFEKATVHADLLKNTTQIVLKKNNKVIKKKFRFSRNELFLKELSLLKKSIIKNRDNFLSIIKNDITQNLYFKLLK